MERLPLGVRFEEVAPGGEIWRGCPWGLPLGVRFGEAAFRGEI